MIQHKIKTLKSGLRIVTVPMKDNPTVTVLVLVGTGSDYEKKEENGISHFLEHMCFKGTVKRPTAMHISHELDALGCEYNAFTDHEVTGYYAKGDSKHFARILDVVADIYLNSTFPETEIEKEKGVIVEEINMYEDMPQRHVHDVFDELVYGDTPAGRNIAGTHSTVRSMSRSNFVRYKDTHYVPDNTVVVVSGSLDSVVVNKEVAKYFKDFKQKKLPRKQKSKVLAGVGLYKKPKITDQVHLMLGVPAFSRMNPKYKTLHLLAAVLGAGMSSRLFHKLREEMGVCYYVGAHGSARTDSGYFSINAGVTTARTQEVLRVLLDECARLKRELVPESELKKVKSYLVGNLKLGLESSDDIANFYGMQLLLKGEIKTSKDKIKEIESVTPMEIKKLANEIFKDGTIKLALVGPESVQIDPKMLYF